MHTPEEVRQLADWLSSAGLGSLELRGPESFLRLQRDGKPATGVVNVELIEHVAHEAAPAHACAIVRAPSVGVVLDRHPLRKEAIATVGTRVRAGQPIALLQVGQLLTAVKASQDGVLARWLVEPGTTVGFGTALAELSD